MEKKFDDSFQWEQFCRLGEMMGDGLHHEPDGKWITREYNRLAKLLVPEIAEAMSIRRRERNARTNESISNLLATIKCTGCGEGKLSQSRSGSRVLYCGTCGSRYKAVTKKIKTYE